MMTKVKYYFVVTPTFLRLMQLTVSVSISLIREYYTLLVTASGLVPHCSYWWVEVGGLEILWSYIL